jgi:hypothetical protein
MKKYTTAQITEAFSILNSYEKEDVKSELFDTLLDTEFGPAIIAGIIKKYHSETVLQQTGQECDCPACA